MVTKLANAHVDIGLVSADIAGAIRFYQDVLGFPVVGSVPIPNIGLVTRFRVGNAVLRILVPDEAPKPPLADGGFSKRVGIRYLALKISNLAETVDCVAAAGFRVAVPIQALRSGVQVALVEDADGNVVELMEEQAQ